MSENKILVPIFEHITVINDEGFEWLEPGVSFHYNKESDSYEYEYKWKTGSDSDENPTNELWNNYTLKISPNMVHTLVGDNVFQYEGEILDEKEYDATPADFIDQIESEIKSKENEQ